MPTDIWRMGAADLAAAIRKGDLSSREVVQAHFDRIAAVNPKVNAVTATMEDTAIAAAEAADRARAAGGNLGPLHGVPISVKENIDVAGHPTTQGIVALAGSTPAIDAPQLGQLRAAGAIPFARTNLPDFGLRWHSDNALRGATKNPWDSSRTPGGSSGGEAAALATGMSPLGLGNDYGGSLRWPSQCNGTAALKPTLGRIPDASAIEGPEPPITLQLFAVQGPMARHVRDLRLAFENMSGPDPRDPWYVPAPLRGPEVPKRVAVSYDPAGMGIDPAVAAGVRRAADALRDAGYQVDEVDPPLVREAQECWAGVVLTEIDMGFRAMLEPIGSPDALTFLRYATEYVEPQGFGQYFGAFSERERIAKEWSLFFERYPLVLGPVSTALPFEVGADLAGAEEVGRILRALSLVVTCNLLGLPVAVVNAGVENGLPQGVQLIANRYREDTCLDAAEAIEDRLGVVTPIDPK